MANFDMEYNSQKQELIISEYGRNLQNLVNYTRALNTKEERTSHAKEVINLLNILSPYNRNLSDYKEKLWNHLFKIANYDLDVDVPEGITIHVMEKEVMEKHLPYPQDEFAARHYGKYVQNLIEKALQMEEGPQKEALSTAIASYMKLAYRTWNKEHYVNDEIIKQDLLQLSGGKLTFAEDYAIENLVTMKSNGNKKFNKKGPSNNTRKPFNKNNNKMRR